MIDKEPKLISLVIPYYNPQFKYFIEAIQSILNQSYSNWEAIIVNDGSNQENTNLLYRYIESLNDKRFSIINLENNCGVSTAKNIGVKNTNGEIIIFLDADDFLLPYDLKQIVNAFNENPDSLIISCDYLYYLKFGLIRKVCTSKLLNKSPIILPRLIVKREVFDLVWFDPKLRRGEDTDFLIQVLNNEYLFNRLILTSETGYIYRFYPSKERLTHNFFYRLSTWEVLKNKYGNERNIFVQEMLKNIENNILEVKYYTLVKGYLTHNSIFKLFKEILSNCTSMKKKIKCLVALAQIIIEQKFLLPFLGINLKFLDILVDLKGNYRNVEDVGYVIARKDFSPDEAIRHEVSSRALGEGSSCKKLEDPSLRSGQCSALDCFVTPFLAMTFTRNKKRITP